MSAAGETTVRVWDAFVRLSHWTVVAAFAVAYLTEDDFLAVHVWAGYAVGALVALRVLWGFVGPRHARFSEFLVGPGAVLAYLRDLVLMRSQRHLGHSPAGGAMVLALLLMLAAIVGTGLATYAVRNNAGPLAGIVTTDFSLSGAPAVVSSSDEGRPQPSERRRRPGRGWKQLHELLANLTLMLVGLHVAGVLVASYAHRENLIRAMINGRKRSESD